MIFTYKTLYTASHSSIRTHKHTHSHTDGGAAMQLACIHREKLTWGSVSCSRTQH
ncbi:hypothetical protein EXN66_Car008550 [Channa argus]|uniref:Uncharacterized protein n=1 Tax=Channa argus TaxID=215402 RepID=A0A6G1PRW0_CHAAH|nr:hypothetical protein EXN66_Car008550 [Channa argus]